MMRYLVEHGIDVNYKNKYDNTALMSAVDNNDLEIVRYLVEHGANVNPKIDKTWVPYWLELYDNKNDKVYGAEYVSPEIIRYLRSRDYIFNGAIAILFLALVVILAFVLRKGYRRKPNKTN